MDLQHLRGERIALRITEHQRERLAQGLPGVDEVILSPSEWEELSAYLYLASTGEPWDESSFVTSIGPIVVRLEK